MFMTGWKWTKKKKKIEQWFPLFYLLSGESLVSIKENTDRKIKKRRKKEKNTDRTQTKLNAPHVRYNAAPIITSKNTTPKNTTTTINNSR